jgi:hypothetical protein
MCRLPAAASHVVAAPPPYPGPLVTGCLDATAAPRTANGSFGAQASWNWSWAAPRRRSLARLAVGCGLWAVAVFSNDGKGANQSSYRLKTGDICMLKKAILN